MPNKFQTPTGGYVSYLDICRALHTFHRANQAGRWCFEPLTVDSGRKNAEQVFVAYLQERLYIFREGNAYRMAYGSNPIEAYALAYEKELKASKKTRAATKHLWHVAIRTPELGWFCRYHGYDAKEARAEYGKAKKIYSTVTVERDGVEYRRWK